MLRLVAAEVFTIQMLWVAECPPYFADPVGAEADHVSPQGSDRVCCFNSQ